MVVAARLSQRVDPRKVITVGLTLFAASLWLMLLRDAGLGLLAPCSAPQALRGFAIMLCIVPSVGMALTGFAMAELRYASGLFNLMRNLGGAIGIAVVNTWLADNDPHPGRAHGREPGRSRPQRAGLRRRPGRPHRRRPPATGPGPAHGPGRARPAWSAATP